MPDFRQREQFNVLSFFSFLLGIAVADLVRHGAVSGSVDQLLRGVRDGTLEWRGFTIVVRHLSGRSAKELRNCIAAQMQLQPRRRSSTPARERTRLTDGSKAARH